MLCQNDWNKKLRHKTSVSCFLVDLTLQDPVLYISFPLLWSLLDFFAANADAKEGFNDTGILEFDTAELL